MPDRDLLLQALLTAFPNLSLDAANQILDAAITEFGGDADALMTGFALFLEGSDPQDAPLARIWNKYVDIFSRGEAPTEGKGLSQTQKTWQWLNSVGLVDEGTPERIAQALFDASHKALVERYNRVAGIRGGGLEYENFLQEIDPSDYESIVRRAEIPEGEFQRVKERFQELGAERQERAQAQETFEQARAGISPEASIRNVLRGRAEIAGVSDEFLDRVVAQEGAGIVARYNRAREDALFNRQPVPAFEDFVRQEFESGRAVTETRVPPEQREAQRVSARAAGPGPPPGRLARPLPLIKPLELKEITIAQAGGPGRFESFLLGQSEELQRRFQAAQQAEVKQRQEEFFRPAFEATRLAQARQGRKELQEQGFEIPEEAVGIVAESPLAPTEPEFQQALASVQAGARAIKPTLTFADFLTRELPGLRREFAVTPQARAEAQRQEQETQRRALRGGRTIVTREI
ncbi:MAG: hypothetical protein V3W51_04795 [Candidatus Brocadiales bacterium]